MRQKTPFSRHLRQFKNLSKRLNTLQNTGRLEVLSPESRARLTAKLYRSFRTLQGVYSTRTLTRILAGAGLLIGLGALGEADAQGFRPPVQNPFGLTPSLGTYAIPAVADMDNDGDLDLFAGDVTGDFDYFMNTGTAAAPAFGAPQVNPFGLTATPYGNFLTIGDLDGDGDNDIVVGNGYGVGDLFYYQNTGTATVPTFTTPLTFPFGVSVSASSNFAIPNLVDIDGDGDLDLFVGVSANNLQYFQNTGTATAPAFAAGIANPFGLTISQFPPVVSFGDVDRDGDFDLILGDYYNNFYYFQNTGTSTAPAFAAAVTNPFGLTNLGSGYPIFLTLADMDGDSDMDLLVGEYYADISYYEDTTGIANTAPVLTAPANDTICAVDSFGPEPFTATDPEGDSLTISAISTNQAVIPDLNITIAGTSPNYTLTATPVAAGLTSIILTADDGNLQTSDTLDIEVEICNTAPVVTAPANDTICDFDVYGPEPFTASDPQNDPLTVTATSNNQAVIPDANISITGTAPNFTISATQLAAGSVTITLTADDGALQASDSHDIFVDNCVGLEESLFVEAFTVFPNPASGSVAFELALLDVPDALTYELIDAVGKRVRTRSLPGGSSFYKETLALDGLPAGIYTLGVNVGVLRLSRKVKVE